MGSADEWCVTCAGCGMLWNRVGVLTDYERQEVESRPCPSCGGYTLSCRERQPAATQGKTRFRFGHRGAA